jgi:phosphatidylglycerol:prolipoprotein diacylglycerol transferase
VHPILFRIPLPDFLGGGSLPLYSYGVMLGLSFIVGWYLTLGLAEKDGLSRETFANCYVITAICAVVSSRLLYVVTNLDDFDGLGDVLELRSGGMVAYGGFVGGFLGSWVYLRWKHIPLIPWADVAVPSLASGLMITRIGCYLYGCDFGRPLSATAPEALKHLGTFPRWSAALPDAAAGSPAWDQHVRAGLIDVSAPTSLPVHPTQLYECLVGLALLVFLLASRKTQRFRGQVFLYFAFFYGAARFGLEFLRDDAERGAIPPALAPHVLFPLCLAVFGAAYAYGIARIIGSRPARVATQVAAFIPALYAYVALKPGAFEAVADVKLSTSQFIGLASAVGAALGFALLHGRALLDPVGAMLIPRSAGEPEEPRDPKDADAEDAARPAKPVQAAGKAGPKKPAASASRVATPSPAAAPKGEKASRGAGKKGKKSPRGGKTSGDA